MKADSAHEVPLLPMVASALPGRAKGDEACPARSAACEAINFLMNYPASSRDFDFGKGPRRLGRRGLEGEYELPEIRLVEERSGFQSKSI